MHRGGERRKKHDEKTGWKITLWLSRGMIRRMDGWLEEDNFAKASGNLPKRPLRFYMGYLAAEDTSEYLPRSGGHPAGTLADNENRLRTLLFKLCVEVNMMGHTVAAHFQADPVNRRELRAYAVERCCAPTGRSAFDDALDLQRQVYPDG